MPTCRRCLEEKPVKAFGRSFQKARGRSYVNSYCHRCRSNYPSVRVARIRWGKANRDKVLAYNAKWRREFGAHFQKQWAKRRGFSTYYQYLKVHTPTQLLARQMFGSAIRSGRILRPKECSACHAQCVPHGHHDDYSKPLEVRWLCQPCHMAHHRSLKAAQPIK